MDAYSDIGILKGVGPKTMSALNKCCIFSVLDLLLYLPREYKSISQFGSSSSNIGKIILNCVVKSITRDIRTKTGKIMSTVIFENEDGIFAGRWFNQPYMKNKFSVNCAYTIIGKLHEFKGKSYIMNPVVVKDDFKFKDHKNIEVIYPLKAGLTNNTFIKLIGQVLKKIKISENLPSWIIKKYNLCSLDKAIRIIHKPKDLEGLREAKRRLKFQELFTYSLKVLTLKEYYVKNKKGIAFKISKELTDLKYSLPYELTESQNKVIREILLDEKKNNSMNRLVQGDVGSGKTIVALIAIFNVVKNGYQAVLMAPTEILARQHYIESKKLLERFNINIELLCGSTTKKNKENIKQDLKNGDIDIIIGTHALIEDDVEFSKLGIIVTDEQHRFGVMQRSKLLNKGKNVDVLVMTATPIPRTLRLYLYGDLNVSTIDSLPPGRQKIDTLYLSKSSRIKAYRFAINEIKNGRQVYIVCPLVEENEDMDLSSVEKLYDELKKDYFKDIPLDMIHGKMSSKVKEDIMNRFKTGKTKAIISTTVIEVGINVPNASLIIIENAERFGLSQLHQLRGRVGRGKYKSYCILIADIKNNIIRRRMEIMKSSNDGFFISEQDLKIRGAGEIFGYRQHGEDELIISDLNQDIDIFKLANMSARQLIESDKEEDIKIKNNIFNKIEKSSKFICFN
ncbi:ATP-dependent DNA helicase RecG [Clostridium tyrobutyricum]|uniref:ATP-dependent DNA helicase RecG n=1 Tax=Clostridium tyrobutyricum TaxID=1519 RepID=UPI002432E855|nr:ATP-dependent DNA helicase RecG [Clostridium tyrobutyricum]